MKFALESRIFLLVKEKSSKHVLSSVVLSLGVLTSTLSIILAACGYKKSWFLNFVSTTAGAIVVRPVFMSHDVRTGTDLTSHAPLDVTTVSVRQVFTACDGMHGCGVLSVHLCPREDGEVD